MIWQASLFGLILVSIASFYMVVTNKFWQIGLIGIAISFAGAYHSYNKYEQYKFEQIHNADAILQYIDTMPIKELRNKMKACQIDQSNCVIVFAEEKGNQ